MRRVILESPYGSRVIGERARNVAYARRALLDSLQRGEAPIASHLLYTQVLEDDVPEQRAMGIGAGLAWADVADATVVYADYGVTRGMAEGIRAASKQLEFRYIGENP